jgi:Flp pilus assembly pilin Flp
MILRFAPWPIPFPVDTGKGISPFRLVEGQSLSPTSSERAGLTAYETGATMLEYALLLLLVALVVFGVAKLLGQNVLPLFQVTQYL